MLRDRNILLIPLAIFLLLLPARTAMAHEYSVAYTVLNISAQETRMEYSIDTLSVIEDLGGDANKDGKLDEAELKTIQPRVEEWFDDSLVLEAGQHQQLAGELEDMKLEQKTDRTFVTARFKLPGIQPGQVVTLTDGILASGAQNTNYANFMVIHAGNSDSQAVLQGKNRTWSMLLTEPEQDTAPQQAQTSEDGGHGSFNVGLVVILLLLAAVLSFLLWMKRKKA
ncbi:MAG: hypothetical protein WCC10_04635 [Tumebacillaceae bacterium]